MNTVPQYDSLAFAESTLKLRTYRQQVIGNNLANSDTPGFKARDIQFGDVLKAQLEGRASSKSIRMATTHVAHIPGKVSQEDPNLLYRIPDQPSMDGNTVDLDIERAHFAENVTKTEAQMRFLAGAFRGRITAMTPDGR